MSGGTVVRITGITSPSFSGGAAVVARQQRDVLLADRGLAVHLGVEIDGILTSDRSDSTASTPVSVRCTALTRPTSVPR